MIITKEVEVILSNKTIFYYENLGYTIPKYLNQWKKLVVKRNTSIKVNIIDLLPNSTIKVLCKCDNCGKEKWLKFQDYGVRRTDNKYFCEVCAKKTNSYKEKIKKSLTGQKRSEETKRKISENHWDVSGKNNPFYGIHKFGKDHPKYNHKLSEKERKLNKDRHLLIGYYVWQKDILNRNNFTCQCCGSNEKLRTHHIENWKDNKEKRIDIDNGITLCENCHKLFHKIYGRKNNNRIQLNEFIQTFSIHFSKVIPNFHKIL